MVNGTECTFYVNTKYTLKTGFAGVFYIIISLASTCSIPGLKDFFSMKINK